MADETENAVPAPTRSGDRRAVILLAALLLPIAAFYIIAALRNHALFGTAAYDLGIFDQALWHLSRFEAPTSTVRQTPSIFGDHFHPAIVLMVPLYWIGDGTRGLLAVQPILVLLAAFPIFRFARRRMEITPAMVLALAYALSWGVAQGVGFDFHEFALTTPILALAIERFDARDRRGFWIAAIALLLTKEDQSLTLIVFGILALWRGDGWRAATLPVAVGVAWFTLTTKLLIPLLAGGRGYEHWLYGYLAPTPASLILYLLTHPVRAVSVLVLPKVKLTLLYRTFGTFLLLPLFSPWTLLAVPSLLSRLLSSEPVHWTPAYHYSMPVMVIGVCATADVLGRVARRSGRRGPRLVLAGATAAFVVCAGMNRGVLQLNQMFRPRVSPDTAAALDRLLAQIPPDASISADNYLAPHLTKREWIVVTGDDRKNFLTEYVVFDPAVAPAAPRLAARLATEGRYDEIGRVGETLLYRRKPDVDSDLPTRPADLPTLVPLP